MSGAVPRWRPTPFVLASGLLHAGALAATAASPRLWPWALGALALDHGILATAGLFPRSRLLGANWSRLPQAATARREVALTFDDGPDPETTPRVLELLRAHGVRASFFCIAARAAAQPELLRRIVEAGHTVGNHTWRHRHDFSLRGPRALAREIDRAQLLLGDLAGAPPRFFRAPAGLRNPFLDPLLQRRGLRLVSWTRRGFDTRTGEAATVHARLVRGLAAGDILLLHDGHAARTAAGEPVLLAVLPPLLATLASAGLRPVPLDEALR